MKKFILCLLALIVGLPAWAVDLSNVKFGGQVRFREYELKNFWNFDNDNRADVWRTFRLKTSLYTAVDLGDNVSGLIRITNQTYGEGISDAEDNKSNKTFVDNAYIDVKEFAGLPLDLRMGRQNLLYGSGFVLFDGQSQYGSTSMYFDAIKASFILGEQGMLDIIYAKDQENDRSESDRDDVTLHGLYLTLMKTLPFQTETYVLNRQDQLKNKDIYMIGLRVSDKLDMGLDYSVEGAFQTGETDVFMPGFDDPVARKADHEAFGGKLDVGFNFKAAIKPRIYTQVAYFSGDDPDTKKYEGWDVFYGGWPQFGDLLGWAFVALPAGNVVSNNKMASTTGEAAYTNFSLYTLGGSLAPVEKLSLKASYSMIKWNEDYINYTGTRIDDDDFGDYYQFSVGYGYSDKLSFGLYSALIDPGEAFKDTAQDVAYEIFYQADLKF